MEDGVTLKRNLKDNATNESTNNFRKSGNLVEPAVKLIAERTGLIIGDCNSMDWSI